MSWDYFTSSCATCFQQFTSTVSQREADQLRQAHDCPGSPYGRKDDQ